MFEAINHVNVPEDDPAAEPFVVEYLLSISRGSIPSSCLPPKICAPLILIQNLSPIEGLCNGTRMRATWNLADVSTGSYSGWML